MPRRLALLCQIVDVDLDIDLNVNVNATVGLLVDCRPKAFRRLGDNVDLNGSVHVQVHVEVKVSDTVELG